jgi:GNAT superfamily N-acetyltransferase
MSWPHSKNLWPPQRCQRTKNIESAYRGEASRAGWTTEADLLDGRRTGPDEIARLLASPVSRILLAERDSCLQACAHLERGPGQAWFGMFAVRPTEQGSGTGSLLLAEAERVARDDWQCRELRMSVIVQREELIDWYQRRGYRRTGERRPFPYGDPRFGLPKRDDLEFEVLAKPLR